MSTSSGPTLPPDDLILQQHDDESFLDALELLISSGKAKTTQDLVRYAQRAGEPAVADFLASYLADELPVDLAFEALRVHVRIAAHRRGQRLLREAATRAVGLVMPLPPHVLDQFLTLPQVTVLVPDGCHLPPHLRGRSTKTLQGGRVCRQAVASCQTLVFEAYRDEQGRLLADAAVSDVVDLRIIPPQTELLLHLRPHPHPGDAPLEITHHSWKVL